MQLFFKPTIKKSDDMIRDRGYVPLRKICKTLQGHVWIVKKRDKKYVIKVTKRSLHKKSMAISNGKKIKISENILKETAILRHLTSNNPPSSLVKYIDFFSNKSNYYLVMEHGGDDFFEFIVKCHKLIAKNLITFNEWGVFCRNAISQMVDLILWLHDKMKCCHYDLSLENFVIDNVLIYSDTNGKMRINTNFQIRLIDFGLSEIFQNNFFTQKYCGKHVYQSPECFNKKYQFNAKKNDIWSLAVCFFMIIIGSTPYNKPIMTDIRFKLIINGKITTLLNASNKNEYINTEIIDLLSKLFTKENQRLNIKDIKKHSFFK